MADARPASPKARTEDAAERLLEREAPAGYLDAWSRSLSAPPVVEETRRIAVTIFRLGEERFALDAAVVREIHVPRRVHRLPGRTNDVFRGLVVLRGEVHLCADLHALLGVQRGSAVVAEAANAPNASGRRARMVLVARGADAWAFEADDVLDVRRFDAAAVAPPQVTVAKASVRFTDGLLELGDGPAARLDPERLFSGLGRSLS